jgi:hypothetical protein
MPSETVDAISINRLSSGMYESRGGPPISDFKISLIGFRRYGIDCFKWQRPFTKRKFATDILTRTAVSLRSDDRSVVSPDFKMKYGLNVILSDVFIYTKNQFQKRVI